MDYINKLPKLHLAPLWEVLSTLVTENPTVKSTPYIWSYNKLLPILLESANYISAQNAERRVLVLENPAMPGESKVTDTLYAGLQLVMPGEISPAHRHTQSALRFIIQGGGAYTALNGERVYMERGDLILTPNWVWHDHGNDTQEPMIWLDALDIPIVNFFTAGFAQNLDKQQHQVTRDPGYNLSISEAGLGTFEFDMTGSESHTRLAYPYKQTRNALITMSKWESPDLHHGYRLKYIDSRSGDWVFPTIATWLQFLPGGFETRPYKSSAGIVLTIVEGTGTVKIGPDEFSWQPDDIIATPAWTTLKIQASEDAIIFAYSDRSAQEKLKIFREHNG